MEKNIQKCFTDWDYNNDGKIMRAEFIEGYRSLHAGMNQDTATERAIEIFNDQDREGTGTMDFGDWSASIVHRNDRLVENNLKIGFELFDKSGTGEIELYELSRIMAKNLKDYINNEETWVQIVKEADADGNGQMDFEEFKDMMRNIQDNYKKL